MDAKLKQKWVEALRSGEYRQTRGVLKDERGFCCLGVLCEVAGISITANGLGVEGCGDSTNEASHASYGPIFELVGGYAVSQDCSMRNDGSSGFKVHSFAEIADYIEANIPSDAGAA